MTTECTITFTGPTGSGKSNFLRIAAQAIKEAGYEVHANYEADMLKAVITKSDRFPSPPPPVPSEEDKEQG